ncbi:MAG TPA: polysaccharide deacetylase family protein [Polyangiaceae bacterium]|nr:polysaccharide deacetylase family protein [Polyangiaceae bacterium]
MLPSVVRAPLLLICCLPWLSADSAESMARPERGVAVAPERVLSPAALLRAPKAPPRARLVSLAPAGERVELGEEIRVEISEAVPDADVLVRVDPPTPTRRRWINPTTLAVQPLPRWRAGRAHRVTVSVSAHPHVEVLFRTQVPPPLAITPGEGKRLLLTFDDGPHRRRQADQLLDMLAKHDAKAIFFPTGKWARGRPDWVARAAKAGHWVCNHTYSHRNLTLPPITEADIVFEIENGASDGKCKLFRPPLMAFDDRVQRIVERLGYQMFLWDIDTRDWEDTPAEDVENFVLSRAKPDGVVLLHIHSEGTHQALPNLLERLTAAGYRLTHEPEAAGHVGEGGTLLADLPIPKPALLD